MIRIARNTYKAKKLIKILLEYEEDQDNHKIIYSIRITGDFFLYPEESLDKLEMELRGTRLDKDELKKKIYRSLINSEVFGFDSESMSDAILGCFTDLHEYKI